MAFGTDGLDRLCCCIALGELLTGAMVAWVIFSSVGQGVPDLVVTCTTDVPKIQQWPSSWSCSTWGVFRCLTQPVKSRSTGRRERKFPDEAAATHECKLVPPQIKNYLAWTYPVWTLTEFGISTGTVLSWSEPRSLNNTSRSFIARHPQLIREASTRTYTISMFLGLCVDFLC